MNAILTRGFNVMTVMIFFGFLINIKSFRLNFTLFKLSYGRKKWLYMYMVYNIIESIFNKYTQYDFSLCSQILCMFQR